MYCPICKQERYSALFCRCCGSKLVKIETPVRKKEEPLTLESLDKRLRALEDGRKRRPYKKNASAWNNFVKEQMPTLSGRKMTPRQLMLEISNRYKQHQISEQQMRL